MMLKVHADRSLLGDHDLLSPLLLPWANDFPAHVLWHDADYARNGKDYFRLTTLKECDFAVWPKLIERQDPAQVAAAAREAKSRGKRLIVFWWTDEETPLDVENAVFFRTSLRASLRGPNEHAMPAFAAHHLMNPELKLDAGLRDKTTKPTVGFCGQLDTLADSRLQIQRFLGRAAYWGLLSRPRLERLMRRFGISITRGTGKRLRYQAVSMVLRCDSIQSNFDIRDRHFDGINEVAEEGRAAHRIRALARFAANVLESDYTLCPRGGGNYSLRLYETLCLGRIPVFINSDCVLPYETLVRWKDYCVWVEEENIETLPTALIDHYNSLTNEEFRALQQKCRLLWLDYLSLDGFFRHFHQHAAIRGLSGKR